MTPRAILEAQGKIRRGCMLTPDLLQQILWAKIKEPCVGCHNEEGCYEYEGASHEDDMP